MNIWETIPAPHGYDRLDLADVTANFRETFHDRIVGKRILPSWSPVKVKLDLAEVRSDFPSLPGNVPLVFNKKALMRLEPLVGNYIEALPLICECDDEFYKELYVINVLITLDCLDVERSEVERFRSGRIMRIERYILRPEILREENAPIFKLPEMQNNRFYVTDAFKNLLDKYQLKGLFFEKIYSYD